MKNINCVWYTQIGKCKNKKIKRGFFGIGVRHCIEYITNEKCNLKIFWPKPKIVLQHPPPPPKIY